MNRVAVALSGGVDSAVTAAILKEQGLEVFGVTAKMFCSTDSERIISNAKSVADKLGIEHFVYDASLEFNNRVIKYFEGTYKKGLTPNPCIMCNKYIKWGSLFDYAINTLKADYIATGHYAKVEHTEKGTFLKKAKDEIASAEKKLLDAEKGDRNVILLEREHRLSSEGLDKGRIEIGIFSKLCRDLLHKHYDKHVLVYAQIVNILMVVHVLGDHFTAVKLPELKVAHRGAEGLGSYRAGDLGADNYILGLI